MMFSILLVLLLIVRYSIETIKKEIKRYEDEFDKEEEERYSQ
jgi:hypothetical protein